MGINFRKIFSKSRTPQSEPIPGSTQRPNSAGGYAWGVDDWTRLDRFLILGTEGGSYYASERALTRDNASAVERCVGADGPRVVRRIVEISDAGRAPKNDPAIFALAMAAKLGDFEARRAAHAALARVCRTGTHLMHFASYLELFGGWGRGSRSAVARWFNDRGASSVAYQAVKYQARDGWSLRDLLRLSHPRAATEAHQLLYRWMVDGELASPAPEALAIVDAFEQAKVATSAQTIARLVREHDLPREAIPTQWLVDAAVWEALLERMPMTAMIRNLATMTRVGLIRPLSAATKRVVERLSDSQRLREARLHPIAVLAALLTYQSGKSVKGGSEWKKVGAVVDALDEAFYRTFRVIEPSNERTLLALDVSGSMDSGVVAGVPGLTPRIAAAAMALVTAATEPQHAFVGFSTELVELDISSKQRLDRVAASMRGLPFAGTDCAQPMIWAKRRKIAVDKFVIYTDSETWAGGVHPAQALVDYRKATGIAAKLVVVGMISNGFTIADPNDAGMLDVVGFDTATPAVISSFGV